MAEVSHFQLKRVANKYGRTGVPCVCFPSSARFALSLPLSFISFPRPVIPPRLSSLRYFDARNLNARNTREGQRGDSERWWRRRPPSTFGRGHHGTPSRQEHQGKLLLCLSHRSCSYQTSTAVFIFFPRVTFVCFLLTTFDFWVLMWLTKHAAHLADTLLLDTAVIGHLSPRRIHDFFACTTSVIGDALCAVSSLHNLCTFAVFFWFRKRHTRLERIHSLSSDSSVSDCGWTGSRSLQSALLLLRCTPYCSCGDGEEKSASSVTHVGVFPRLRYRRTKRP